MKQFLILLIVLQPSIADDDKPVTYRLLEHQKPERYDLHLEFKKDLFQGTGTEFTGNLTIDFKVMRTVNYIQFHAPVLIKSKEFLDNKTLKVPIESESYDPVTHIYTITAKEKLNYTHNYTLRMEYSGNINTKDMTGVYRSSYVEDGSTEYFVGTHFLPTFARFAFPCFDEPKMKATFVISIVYPKGLTALSNAVGDGSIVEVDDDYEKVVFKETPVMSTHLVGFLLSKLTCSQGQNITNGVPYRVCSRKERVEDRVLALGLGPQFMERMENITGLNYTDHLLGKLDQVAVPGYKSRYLENWGLNAYKEASLLWNIKESSITYRNVVMDLFLELAHNWFGNLETVVWWDYTYLNLGFAKFYQYHATAQIDEFTKWELGNQFVVDQLQPSLVLDALPSSSALSYPVQTPAEILTKFDEFAFSKGASVVRMAQHVIGPQNFQKGIRYFLPIYNGSNIMPIYVWNKLEVFIPRELLPRTKNLNGVMENWTEKAGYPLVTVTVKGTNVLLTQERFLYSREEDFTEWCIPITYTLSKDIDKFQNTTTKVWLLPETSQTLHDILEDNDWLILNNQQVGYYRVNYDAVLWDKIKQLLFTNHTAIHVLNRVQIVDDVMNLARAQILNYSYAFEIIKYLKEETEYYPWYSAIKNFNYLLIQLGEDSIPGIALSSMILDLIQKVYRNLSFEDVDPDDQIYILKMLLVSGTACRLGEEACVDYAKTKFKARTSVDKNLKSIVYCNGLRHSDDVISGWNSLWEMLQNEVLESERETIIEALGCAKDVAVLKFYLDQSVNSSSAITLEELPKVWMAVYGSSPEGVDAALDYLYENFTKLATTYPTATSILVSLIERLSRAEQLEKVQALVASGHLESSVRAVVQSALKAAEEKLQWVGSVEEDLLAYFKVTETTTEEGTSTTTGSAKKLELSFALITLVSILVQLDLTCK
ncbi:hypothetical protein NQ315_003109 [Exocentrus adspersus]|uniref:Aminopeptidase n=1 Tax=Exocentrus adspersus TaxID=1586481 RepID=A0AAV8W699_9CUCU|nr:hypothetical protein NQ315_003109 [Exocentrus adspersus]